MIYSKEIFTEKARKVHGNKYDYSKVVYKNSQEKVCIICPEHGEFWQTPSSHLQGHGCPKCSCEQQHLKFKSNTEEFIAKARKVHGDKYDYSNVAYTTNENDVCIICPKHGEFLQKASRHLSGAGCPKCGKESMVEKQSKTTDKFIEEAKKIHADKYDYSKVSYKGANKKVCIICPEHGEFWQTPSAHTNGKQGCPTCGRESSNRVKMLTREDFIAKARLLHGEKYSYEKVKYKGYDEYVTIICPEHGEFLQTPDSHLQGKGCRMCGMFSSEKEEEIFSFCKTIDHKAERRNREIISPYEIDIYLPSFKIGIEYNGLLWHSNKFKNNTEYHLLKTELCKNAGIKLIQIFEDEYVNSKEIVQNKILHILNASNLPKIMARKCTSKEIKGKEAKLFLTKNHIQGFAPSSVYLGCFFKENLIGVMSFKESPNGSKKWELTRFASDNNYICQGVGGKLFNEFLKKYNPDSVKSFSDRRWAISENNNLYTKLGFHFDGYTKPDYRYFKPNTELKRIHKFNLRKKILSKKYGFPLSMTEEEMAKKAGFLRVYDCGLIKYIWKKGK